jgi:light-regulated signal transduction histidine kinase (bacteriophytochrome)
MSGFAQILLDNYRDKLGTEGQDCLQEIHQNAVKMAGLIDALLALSRVTRSEPKPELVDLTAVARSIVAQLAVADPGRTVEVQIEDYLQAHLDPQLARILLENLLGNAWKFTNKVSPSRIEFGSTTVDGVRTFFVRDNGAGFDMAYASKLFVPFQRLHATSEFSGKGIGLATVQRIVRLHGGRIEAEGGVNAGATLRFTLP